MKVNRVDSTPPQAAAGSTSDAAVEPVTPTAPIDRVSTSQLRTSVETGMALASGERSERLHHLAQAVRAGSYRPSASQLAEQILAEAERDARLANAIH